MVSNTGDIPGTSGGGGSLQSSLGTTAMIGIPGDMTGSSKGPGPIARKRRRGVRSRSFYNEAGRVKKQKQERSMKRKARRVSGRR